MKQETKTSAQQIVAVVCRQMDGGIGKNNDLLYKGLPGDMKRFKNISVGNKGGNVNIMGRKNWESIPEKWRPFGDGRITIVVSRSNHPEISRLPNCWVINNPLEALHFAQIHFPDRDIIINGGGEIYKALLPYCSVIYSTDVIGNREADVFVEYPQEFFAKSANIHLQPPHNGIDYAFADYEKK